MVQHILLRSTDGMFREPLTHYASLSAMHFFVNAVVGVEDFGKIGVRSITVALLKVLALAVDT